MANGKGIRTFHNGDQYDGEWVEGKMVLFTSFNNSVGFNYVGNFTNYLNGKLTGTGWILFFFLIENNISLLKIELEFKKVNCLLMEV